MHLCDLEIDRETGRTTVLRYTAAQDVGRALAVAARIESGICHINSATVADEPQMPFGGMKASGIGRDGGDYSFDFYMETKNVAVAYDTHSVPKIGS